MKHVTLVDRAGRKRIATRIDVAGGRSIVVTGRISEKRAERYAREFQNNPRGVKGLARSVARFEEFNNQSPRRLRRQDVPLDVPFVRIGKVPIITYMSKKEGKLRAYKHETKRMPTLYMHPTKPVGLLLGGSLKVRDWLYD